MRWLLILPLIGCANDPGLIPQVSPTPQQCQFVREGPGLKICEMEGVTCFFFDGGLKCPPGGVELHCITTGDGNGN